MQNDAEDTSKYRVSNKNCGVNDDDKEQRNCGIHAFYLYLCAFRVCAYSNGLSYIRLSNILN